MVNPSESLDNFQYTYDVFISYSTQDEDWVRGELLQCLESNDLRVCIDFRDFRPGHSNIEEIKRAIRESRKILLVLTPQYLSSRWTGFERQIYQNLAPQNLDARLIPLLKEQCKIPDEINYLVYVNLTQPNSEMAWSRLLQALARSNPGSSSLIPSSPVERQPYRQRIFPRRIYFGLGLVLLFLIGILVSLLWQPPELCSNRHPKVSGECLPVWQGDVVWSESVSSGEHLLLSGSQENSFLQQASNDFKAAKYSNAANAFLEAPKNPEAVIYRNNALARQVGDPYLLAVVVPASRQKQDIAQEILRGAADAQTQFNANPSNRQVELIIANDDDDPDTARAIAQGLANNSSMLGVIGHYSSQVSQAALKIYEPSKLAMVSPTSTATNLSSSEVFFRTAPSNQAYAQKLAEHLTKDPSIKNIAVFYHKGNSYSYTFKNDFESFAPGITTVQIDLKDRYFNADAEINKLFQNGVHSVLLIPSSEIPSSEIAEVALNIAEAYKSQFRNQKLKLFGGDVLYTPEILKESGNAFLGMILVVPWFASNSGYAKDAERTWGGQISYRTAGSFDAAQALISTLKHRATRSEVLQQLKDVDIESIDKFGKATTSGQELRFRENGDRNIDPVLVQVVPRSVDVPAPQGAKFGFKKIP